MNKSEITNIFNHLISIIYNIALLLSSFWSSLFPFPLILRIFPFLFFIVITRRALSKIIIPTILQFMPFLTTNHTSLLLLIIGLLEIFAFTFLLERFLASLIGHHSLFLFMEIHMRSFFLLQHIYQLFKVRCLL